MLKIRVNTAEAEITEKETITAGRKGLTCKFEFNDAWDGLAKTAVFVGAVSVDVVLVYNTVVVPPECIERANFPLKIGVYGASADGTVSFRPFGQTSAKCSLLRSRQALIRKS